jgi:hypothetical protein
VNYILAVICFFLCISSSVSMAADLVSVQPDGTVLTEDTTWRGSISVKGSVVVAPQATLRVEPGTVIRFSTIVGTHSAAQLVIQGRIQAIGTAELPIVMTSASSQTQRGSWGGIVLMATEKKNIIEQCRIENADTGLALSFSSLSLKSVSIVRTLTAVRARDSLLQISGGTVADSDIGLEIHDSELEAHDMTVSSCRKGSILHRSAVALTSVSLLKNTFVGMEAEECRVKIVAGTFSDNALGATFIGGEGQILTSRFMRNSGTALQLSAARLKIQRCQFAENRKDAVRVEDGRALLFNNSFSSNGGYNLYNAGSEEVNVRLNWWGSAEPAMVMSKIFDPASTPTIGNVRLFPWLLEKMSLEP